jgi:hypothetical protein
MRIPIWITILFALLGAGVVVVVGQAVLQPPRPLIVSAGFDDAAITPNADGEGDVTRFAYEIARNATVSLILEAEDGTQYIFRDKQPRLGQAYSVLFSGVVDGFTLPDEEVPGTVERRLLPNATYTWRLSASNDAETQEASGTLTVADANPTLPLITSFSVGPTTFTPNQDGIDDRVEISVYLENPAELRVFLQGESGREYPISARKEGRLPGEAGRHVFDYEGGIDLNAEPPPDGTYKLIAVAQDAEGQRIRQETELTILQGGKPLAEIVPQAVGVDVVFEAHPYDERYFTDAENKGDLVEPPSNPAALGADAITMQVGDMLVFKLTIENYSNVPVRTTTPPPGTVYQQEQLAAGLGAFESSGAWRVGIQCETSAVSYPYRWAIGSADVLDKVEDEDTGEIFYYLAPGKRSIVWGAIRLTSVEERQNPQNCWAGLIHEDVEVSLYNSVVGLRSVELVDPNAP